MQPEMRIPPPRSGAGATHARGVATDLSRAAGGIQAFLAENYAGALTIAAAPAFITSAARRSGAAVPAHIFDRHGASFRLRRLLRPGHSHTTGPVIVPL